MKNPFAFSFLIFNFSFLISFSQVWYFGNGAGLDFFSGYAKPIHDGNLFTLEGCATVCNEKGQLLFYTNGVTIWNRFHQVMQNGEGLNGSQSSTQSALIVPQPLPSLMMEGKGGKYFLFTTDEKAGEKGLCYSVVDFSSEAGVVVKKNIQLLPASAEKITAVQHANGKDAWVIAHQWNSNNFYTFPVTLQGVGAPVISVVGASHSETGAGENRESTGYLHASPDGKKIASVVCYRARNNLEIFDFDNSTGKISNVLTVNLSGFPYGLCFSPDNTKLYVSFLKGKSTLVQYDMNDQSIAEIVANPKDNSFGSLQLAPDGKIYVARTGNFLDVIEDPNKKANACRYKSNAVDLSPASSNFGLPNFWSTFPIRLGGLEEFDCSRIIEKPFSIKGKLLMTEISVCENEYTLHAKNDDASFNWSTGEATQTIKIDTSGWYRVAITKEGCTVRDSIRIRFRKYLAVFRFLPAFNPENDFVNSEFYYEIDEVQEFELKVFGAKRKNVLFETMNVNKKWNGKNKEGKIVPDGEYFWTVKYKPNCPKESKLIVQEGKVSVKRRK